MTKHTRLPPEFLNGLDDRTRWMYETIDRLDENQQRAGADIRAVSERLTKGEDRFDRLERDVDDLKSTRLILQSKWSVAVIVVTGILWPILLLLLGKWIAVTFAASWVSRGPA